MISIEFCNRYIGMIQHVIKLLFSVGVLLLSGCGHEEVVFFYASSDYPDEIMVTKMSGNYKVTKVDPRRQVTLRFGPYYPNLGKGRGSFGGNFHPYRGKMKGEEIIAFWRVPAITGLKHYYVRTNPEEGIIRAPRKGRNAYHVGVAMGPMRVLKSALTRDMLETAEVARNDAFGDPLYYRWGEFDKLYYITGVDFLAEDLSKKPHTFHEVQGIEITEKQYNLLYERCYSDWWNVRCFMDESFPELSEAQLAYIRERAHPDDQDRLSGKVPKPKLWNNPWK